MLVIESLEGVARMMEDEFAMRFPFLAAHIQRDSSAPLRIPFPSSIVEKFLDYLITNQDDDINKTEIDLFSLLGLVQVAHNLELSSLVNKLCQQFVDIFTSKSIQDISQELFLTSSVMRRGMRGTSCIPSHTDKLIAESKMLDPRVDLKLGSGIPTRINNYSSKVAKILKANATRKIEKIKQYAGYLRNLDQEEYLFFVGAAEMEFLFQDDPALSDHHEMLDIIRLLVGFLNPQKDIAIKCRAAKTLSSITNWRQVSKEGLVPNIVKLITECKLHEAPLLILANLAEDYSASKDILDSDVLSLVEEIAIATYDYKKLSSCAKFLVAICRSKNDFLPHQTEAAFRIVKRLLRSGVLCTVQETLIALKYLSLRRADPIDKDVCQFLLHILECFSSCDHIVSISVLEVVGNVGRWGDDMQIQDMVENGILKYLEKLLTHEYKVVHKEACRTISNLTARSWTNIEDSCKRDLIYSLREYLRQVESPDAKIDAMWAIFNCITHDIKYKEIRWPVRNSMAINI